MPKIIRFEVRNEDYKNLEELAKKFDTTPKKILKQFFNDIVENASSGGSDERRIAEEWFYRSQYNF